jgi:hypothetical protein
MRPYGSCNQPTLMLAASASGPDRAFGETWATTPPPGTRLPRIWRLGCGMAAGMLGANARLPVLARRVRYCVQANVRLLGELRKWLSRAQNVEDDP